MRLHHRSFTFIILVFASIVGIERKVGFLASEKLEEAKNAFVTKSKKDLGDLNSIDRRNQTVLSLAVNNSRNLEFIKFLVAKGADPLVKTAPMDCPLIISCAFRKDATLLQLFYDVGIRYPTDDQSMHAFLEFIKYGPGENQYKVNTLKILLAYLPCLELLIKLGCPFNIENPQKETPLGRALTYGYLPFVQKFLEFGANPFSAREISPWARSQEEVEMRAISLELILAAKKKIFCTLIHNKELYFSILPNDAMKEASNYIE